MLKDFASGATTKYDYLLKINMCVCVRLCVCVCVCLRVNGCLQNNGSITEDQGIHSGRQINNFTVQDCIYDNKRFEL